MDWTGPLVSFGGSVVVAIIVAVLTVHLALRRFYTEKWWERKSAAYTEIVEALHHVRNHADTNLAFLKHGRELPEEGEKELTEKLEGAMAELRKQLDIGNLVLSEEAVAAMNKLMTELEASTNTDQWHEHLALKLIAVDRCLADMRHIARKDLRFG